MSLKKILNFLKSKVFIVAMLILIQLLFFLWIISMLSEYFLFIYFILVALSFIMSIYVLNKNDNPSYKIAWVIMIMTLPVFGGLIYLLFGGQKVPKELRKRDHKSQMDVQSVLWQNQQLMEELKKDDPISFKQSNYIWESADYPLYQHTD